ncbi:MAG: four helix bundle protein [Kiritimatiellales bacterium]|jgi:four helix bundle protein
MSKGVKFDLEERLIDFAARCIKVANSLPNTQAGVHLSGQLTRSGTSPALNYGEAQGAESRKDFVHKMRICLKELRETCICLKIIICSEMLSGEKLQPLIDETNELISIFVTSIKTAKTNMTRTS